MGPNPPERNVSEGNAVARHASSPLRWAAVPAAVGLLVLVVLGSRTASLPPVGGGFDASAVLSAMRVVGYVALIIGLPSLPVAILLFRRRQQHVRVESRSAFLELPTPPLWARVIGASVILAVFAGQVLITVTFLGDLLRAARITPDGTSDFGGLPDPNGLAPLDRDSASLVVALLIVAAMVVLALGFAVRWRLEERRRAVPVRQDEAAVASRAVAVSLAALQAERDPRRAVIEAYAAMERVLATAGLGRDGSEAPIEYLRRVLAASFGSRQEIATITHLFQIAKFSNHDVDEPMRAGAIEALQRIRERAVEAA